MTEYTPTTEEVRIKYKLVNGTSEEQAFAEFDRWLTAYTRVKQAEALEEAAAAIEADFPESGPHIGMTQYREGVIDGMNRAVRMASRRAAEYRKGEGDE